MVMNAYWMVTAVIGPEHGITKEQMMAALDAHAISTRPFFYPLSSLPAYAGTPGAIAAQQRNRIAYSVAKRGLNLPSALNLTREQVAYVCDRFRRVLAHELAA
jgi:perosamine synthetase